MFSVASRSRLHVARRLRVALACFALAGFLAPPCFLAAVETAPVGMVVRAPAARPSARHAERLADAVSLVSPDWPGGDAAAPVVPPRGSKRHLYLLHQALLR